MSSKSSGGTLHNIYRKRVGDPTTHDEVRGYWVFIVGLILGTLGILLFLPSTSAAGTTGFSLRELSIFLAAVGLAMLVAGPVIRLPLQAWANYAAYLGQIICFAAAVWFMMVFPANWSVQTGSQPVIILYGIGLAIVAIGGVIAPLLLGVTQADLDASEGRAAQLEAELAEARQASATADGELADLYNSQARFELYQDQSEEWRWRLRHRNGNIIADSGESYTRKHNAQKGLASVRRNALGATNLLIEREAELPDAGEVFDPLDEQESQAAFELYTDQAGTHRYRLRHQNGNILGDSGEGYSSRSNAERAIERVRDYAGLGDYLWFDPAGFEVYLDAAEEWRWRLVHRNGNIIADSGEGYTRRNDANRAVERIRERAGDAGIEVYADNHDEYRWRMRGGNNQIIADSGEGYSTRSDATSAAERVRDLSPESDVLTIGRAAFELYEDTSGEHRWRLRHQNGNILLDSGEGYTDRSSARDGIESVKRNAPTAEVELTDD